MSVSIGELHGTVSLEDRFSNAFKVASGVVEGALDSMGSKFKLVAIAGGAITGAIVGIAGTIASLAIKGSALNDLDRGFEKLAGSTQRADEIMRAMERGTARTVDSTKLLEFANRALQTGSIKTAEGFGTVTAAARVLSRQGLGSIESVMGTVNNALATGRTRQLQFLVGSIDLKAAEEKYAKSLGVTRGELSAAGKLSADRIAIMERLSQTVKNAGTVETSFAEKITAARLAIGNWFDDVAKAVAKSGAVNKAFDDIKNAIVNALGGSAEKAMATIVGWINKFAEAVGHYGPIIINWVSRIIDGIKTIWTTVQKAWDLVPDWFKHIAKDAALAGGAVYAAQKALSVLGGGGGFGIPELATTISGARDTILSLKEVSAAAAAPVAAFFVRMNTLYRLDGLSAVMFGISTSIKAVTVAILASPLGVAGLFAAGIAGIYELTKAVANFGDNWKAGGGTLWGFLTLKDDDTFVRRMLRSIGVLDQATKKINEMKSTINMAGLVPLSQSPNRGLVQGNGLPNENDPNQIDLKSKAKEVADATNASIEQTAQRWREYFQELDKLAVNNLDKQLREIDTWYQAERSALDKTKKNSADYQNNLIALDEQFRMKQLVTAELYHRQLAEDTVNAAAAEQKIWEAKQERIKAIDDAGYEALVKANDEYADMVKKEAMSTAEYQIEQIERWLEAQARAWPIGAKGWEEYYAKIVETSNKMRDMSGMVNDDGRVISGEDYEAGHQMVNPDAGMKAGKAFREGFARGMAGFPQLLIDSLTGGGGVMNAFKALGANITNSLFGKDGSMESVTKGLASSLSGGLAKMLPDGLSKALGSAISSLLPGVGALVGPLVDKIVSFFKGIGGSSKQELAGRGEVDKFQKQFADTEEMINRVGDAYATIGMTREQAQADIKAMWDAEKLGAEAAEEAIRKVEDALKRASEVNSAISSLGIKSQDELMHAADIANAAYKKIAAGVATGQYTAEDAAKAYMAYQEALAATGDAAAKAWVEAHKAIDKAETAADKAMDALLNRKTELEQSYANEAWEKDIGVVETAARAEVSRIEEQMKASEDAATKVEETFDTAAEATEQAFRKTTDNIGDNFKRMADGVADYLRRIFGDLKLDPKIDLPYPGGTRSAPQTAFPGGASSLGGFAPSQAVASGETTAADEATLRLLAAIRDGVLDIKIPPSQVIGNRELARLAALGVSDSGEARTFWQETLGIPVRA